MYDFSEKKKKEAWGTESILNALLLALEDHRQGRKEAGDTTKKALANLWKAQLTQGEQQGSWDWLNFDLEPWESKGGRYFGATLAALAVGTAPGYYVVGRDADLDAKVNRLRSYLRTHQAKQNLNNRIWLLWASTTLKELLGPEEQRKVIETILEKQQGDGGWNLSSLGAFVRSDGTPQDTASDGYATGLILHVLQTAGVSKNDPKLAKGLAWLQANQTPSGAWLTRSVNKQRNLDTHVGKFMSDAATAFAVLALSHPD
jgi:squalene-hopene/tetraprenyl-beta-curcumene cyclase